MSRYIALTFDDGPSTDTTAAILELLEKYKVKASFFVCGQSITDESAPIMRRAFDMGCEINNHSYSHTAFTELTEAQMREETSRTSDMVERITGQRPRFFRPPYISIDERVMDTVDMPFICGICTEDWDDNCSADRRYAEIMAQVCDDAIILMHDMQGNFRTVEAVSRIIPALQADEYEFVTVSELFDVKNTDPHENRFVYSVVPQKTVMYSGEQLASKHENGKEHERISVCGDNCSVCPRYNEEDKDRLTQLAQLWFRLGWRDRIVEPEEMRCTGCGSQGRCAYGLLECCEKHEVERCTQCRDFPCVKIEKLLERSEQNRLKCAEICSQEEYHVLARAFYEKEKYLFESRAEIERED